MEVLDELGVDYKDGAGEAALWAKLDFQFITVTGREETVSTVQLDFAVLAHGFEIRRLGWRRAYAVLYSSRAVFYP